MKFVKKMFVIIGAIIGVILASLFIFVYIPFTVNKLYMYNSEQKVLWEAKDVLEFYGAGLAACGTAILGAVAYKQNNRLNKLNISLQEQFKQREDDNFIANYSCFALLEALEFTFSSNIPCNYETHYEQMLQDNSYKEELGETKMGFECNVDLKPIKGYPALIYVEEFDLFVSDEDTFRMKACLFASNIDNNYSRVAIQEKKASFKITVLIDAERRKEIKESIDKYDGRISADMRFDLVTDNYVVTKCKCRAELKGINYNTQKEMYDTYIVVRGTQPLCFWYGHELSSKEKIKTKIEEF
ncbi:hypothetical protein SAMN05421659_11452 [[Clostridium] fimetarium]|uniref:Uncharacterized protein n=2 Tax=[Clostridium] fimetarium TaxID=99656 RepID=A0A1I0RDG7_9FIRM|nr:hypothetical protein SAMN05421659_11452 [[Clostridium] fimetarium]